MTFDRLHLCFGRKQHDPDALAAAPQHKFSVAVPPVLSRGALNYAPGLYQNDVLPDCTAAALANHLAATTALMGYAPAIVPALVPKFFAACIGKPNATIDELALTDGAVALDVLQFALANGFQLDEQAPYMPTHEVVDVSDRMLLAHSIAINAGYWGVALTQRTVRAFQTNDIWDDDGSDHSGIVGTHMLTAWDYSGFEDDDLVTLATWGEEQKATWRWVEHNLDESYALAWGLPQPS